MQKGELTGADLLEGVETVRPDLRLLRRPLHRQQHELHGRGAGAGAALERHHPRRLRQAKGAGQATAGMRVMELFQRGRDPAVAS